MSGAILQSTSANIGSSMGAQYSMAYNTTTNMLYTLNNSTKSILVTNIGTGAYVTSIALTVAPTNIILNPTTNMLYVSTGTTTLYQITGATNTIYTTITLPLAGSAMGINPQTGYLYIIGPTTTVYAMNVSSWAVNIISVYASATNFSGNFGGANSLSTCSGIFVDTAVNKVYLTYTNAGMTAVYMCVISGIAYSNVVTLSTTAVGYGAISVIGITGGAYVYVSWVAYPSSVATYTISYINTSTYSTSACTGPGLGTSVSTYAYGAWANQTTGLLYFSNSTAGVVINPSTYYSSLEIIPILNQQYAYINQTTNTMYLANGTLGKVIDLATLVQTTFTFPNSVSGFLVTPTNVLCALGANYVNLLTFAQTCPVFTPSTSAITLSGGNKIQSGYATSNSSSVLTVNFPSPYTAIPAIVVTGYATSYGMVTVTSATVSSFTVQTSNDSTNGLQPNMPFNWVAVGT